VRQKGVDGFGVERHANDADEHAHYELIEGPIASAI
jgi:hypothetical protein